MDSRDLICDEKSFFSIMLTSMDSTDFELQNCIEVCFLFQESWQRVAYNRNLGLQIVFEIGSCLADMLPIAS